MSDYTYMNCRESCRETELELTTGNVDEDNLPSLVIEDKRSNTIGATFAQATDVDPWTLKCFASFLAMRETFARPTRVTENDDHEKGCRESGHQANPEEFRSNREMQSALKGGQRHDSKRFGEQIEHPDRH